MNIKPLLKEAMARQVKGHSRYYMPFPNGESNLLREYYASQIPPLSNNPLYTPKGQLLAQCPTRYVIGDFGAYIEIDPKDINQSILVKKFKGEPIRPIKYVWFYPNGEPEVKVYYQLGTVKYADYRVGYYYVAPSDVICR